MEVKATKVYLGVRQKTVLDFVMDHLARFGFAPTQEEIGKGVGIKRTLVLYHLSELERKGLIKRVGVNQRNIIMAKT